MDILGQSSLLVAVTSFALGTSALSRNVRNKLFLAFFGVCSLISVWAVSFFLEKIWAGQGFYRVHLMSHVWLAPASLALIRVMVRIQDGFSRRLLDLSVITSVALTTALLFRLERTDWILQVVYFSPAFIVVQTLELMWIDRRLRRGMKRLPKMPTVGFGRRNLIYLGALLALASSTMDHVPWLGTVVPAFGNILLTIYLFFISQAITQQRLLNFGALFSRFLVLVAVALTLTLIYSLLVAWIQDSPGLFFLNSFIASFLILTLLEPLRTLVGSFTQRLLTQKHRRLQQTLRDAQRRLTGIVDPGALYTELLMVAEQTLQPQWAALYVLRSDATKFRRARATGVDSHGESLREVLANHALLQYCERQHRRGELPVLLDQIIENEIDRSASRVQRETLAGLIQGLRALGCNLLIPLFDSGQILGFVTLYAPQPPEPWGSNWGLLSILYPYFEQAAQTLRNMEVYVRQREKERLAALGEMAAGLAHEIRNPLGAIKGAAQMLEGEQDSRFLGIITEEVDRLNRVVTQFLDYSKPGIEEQKLIDATTLVERTVESLRPGLRKGVRLEFVPSRQPARVLAAPGQIQQILINLIQNSHKAIEKRRPDESVIRVSVEVEGNGPNREVTLTVEDNGVGIKREHLDKLFIPFFTTSPSGTGLGLSICHKIVEAHRGRIEVASEEGRYARFSVVLPYSAGENA